MKNYDDSPPTDLLKKNQVKHCKPRLSYTRPTSAWSTPSSRRDGTDEATSSAQPQRPCDEFSSNALELVKLRYFAGMTHGDAAESLGISRATADRYWAYAKAFLFDALENPGEI
jgi:DNA-directed RNA polymerase specialized sigma24 family protein